MLIFNFFQIQSFNFRTTNIGDITAIFQARLCLMLDFDRVCSKTIHHIKSHLLTDKMSFKTVNKTLFL